MQLFCSLPVVLGCHGPCLEKDKPSLQLFFATHRVPCEKNVDVLIGFRIVSPNPIVLYEKIFDLSRKSMFFTSFLLERKLSESRPAHARCGQ